MSLGERASESPAPRRVGHPSRRQVAPNGYKGIKARIASVEDPGIIEQEVQKVKTIAGIDVGKRNLDASVSGGPVRRFPNTPEGIAQLLEWLREHGTVDAVYEATGGYERPLEKAIVSSDIQGRKAHPGRARSFSRLMGVEAKTDRLDAQALAHYGEKFDLPKPLPLDADAEELKDLLGRRKQLKDQLVQEKNRLDKQLAKGARESLSRHVEWMEEEIKEVEKACKEILSRNQELSGKVALYSSVPGIGAHTGAVLAVCMPELGKCSPGQASSLGGLAPWSKDSGKTRGRRSVRGGRVMVRHSLYTAAMSAIQRNQDMKRFYLGLRERGKPGKAALTAVMRKLITILNAILRDQKPWQTA